MESRENREKNRGFTLLETLVAISLLTIALVAPMSLVAQSLAASYYARDQVTAFNLAQEGIEALRSLRDANILENALFSAEKDLLVGIPISQPFVIDARNNTIWRESDCSNIATRPMKTDGSLYGYGTDPCLTNEAGWAPTVFTRTLTANWVSADHNEIRISVAVSWRTARGQTRTVTIYENLYRWVASGSAAE